MISKMYTIIQLMEVSFFTGRGAAENWGDQKSFSN